MNARLLFVHALSPLHAGTGQGVGVIDLPIAREKATELPILPGSSLKGPLRDNCTDEAQRIKVFGPDTQNASDHAGSVQFADGRLLLLPIRSVMGTFAWVTSPYILLRFRRDARDAGASDVPTELPRPAAATSCVVADQGCGLYDMEAAQAAVVLEDLDLKPVPDKGATAWAGWLGNRLFPDGDQDHEAWRTALHSRFCVVHDDVLQYLLGTATEITARVRLLDGTKTVTKGGLWYEEALPAESILAGLVVATPVRATPEDVFRLLEDLTGKTIQFGGKATVGRGLCRVLLTS